jgi:hypothetical protein
MQLYCPGEKLVNEKFMNAQSALTIYAQTKKSRKHFNTNFNTNHRAGRWVAFATRAQN